MGPITVIIDWWTSTILIKAFREYFLRVVVSFAWSVLKMAELYANYYITMIQPFLRRILYLFLIDCILFLASTASVINLTDQITAR